MYDRVFVAGTFDRLHNGHDAILTSACEAGEEVTIGLTSDVFVAKFKKDHTIAPFLLRKQSLEQWLAGHGYADRALIIPIDDPYEPAATLTDLEVLVVTPDNKSRGEEINRIRKEKGLTPLGLLVVALVPAQDSKPVSSTSVRGGQIDRTGRLIMPDNLRPELGTPIGQVLIGDAIGSSIEAHRRDIIVTVGDITTKTLLTAGAIPSLSIVDFRVERKPYLELDGRFAALNIFRVRVSSGPGFIAQEAISVIKKWATHPRDTMVVVVDGEEDLLALPAIAYAPLTSVVYYGQPARLATLARNAVSTASGQSVAGGPGEGMVEVVISADKQQEAKTILTRFQ